MIENTHHIFPSRVSGVNSDRYAKIFVWSIWMAMMLIAVACIVKYGKNIPIWEDWDLVAPLTGNEPHLFSWLWKQNAEHRIPFPKLIFLILLKSTLDFRVGMLFDTISLWVLSLVMIITARNLRGGRTIFADAFFPIALLHMGNWEIIVWSWEITLVLPTVLFCTLFLIAIIHTKLDKPIFGVLAGTCIILLPLSGASGVILTPLLTIWLIYCGFSNWHSVERNHLPITSLILIISAIIAIAISGLYFVSYENQTWLPPNPGLKETLGTTAKILALSLGPATSKVWDFSIITTISFLIVSTYMILQKLFVPKNPNMLRCRVIFLFGIDVLLLAFAIGWGRASMVPEWGVPYRYGFIVSPILIIAFFIWILYGPLRINSLIQTFLMLIMLLLVPLNTIGGYKWSTTYRENLSALENDIYKGIPKSTLVKLYRTNIIPWWDDKKLATGMQMLHDARIGPFVHMREE